MDTVSQSIPQTVSDVDDSLRATGYISDEGIAAAVFLALRLQRPLLLEGFPGCGKTDCAKALGEVLKTELIRLQCYDGLGAKEALYDWDYSRQLLHLRAVQNEEQSRGLDQELYSERFLLARPLLRALQEARAPVVLIDEIDRADADFEAFLLEFLDEFQVTIPEIGSVTASARPHVVLTSNRTRELHDALKRRCIYHWIDLPTPERELEIIRSRCPDISKQLAHRISIALQRIRALDLAKKPGVAEAIDWARALMQWQAAQSQGEDWAPTLGALLKNRRDLEIAREQNEEIFAEN